MKTQTKTILINTLKLCGVALAVYLGMRFLLPVTLPFLIAAALACLLHPVSVKLGKKIRLKSSICNLLVFAGFLILVSGILAGILYFVCSQLGNWFSGMGPIEEKISECCRLCEECISDLCGEANNGLKDRLVGELRKMITSVSQTVSSAAMRSSVSGLKTVGAFLAVLLIVLVSTVLILNDFENLKAKAGENPVGHAAFEIIGSITNAGGSYFKAQFKIIACITGLCILGMFLTGNRYAVLVGLGIGFCDALPFLGTGTILIPWAFIDILRKQYLLAVGHVALYLVCLITRQFLEPKLIGKGVGVHPLAVLMSIYIGICVYGGIGVILGPASALLIREIYHRI